MTDEKKEKQPETPFDAFIGAVKATIAGRDDNETVELAPEDAVQLGAATQLPAGKFTMLVSEVRARLEKYECSVLARALANAPEEIEIGACYADPADGEVVRVLAKAPVFDAVYDVEIVQTSSDPGIARMNPVGRKTRRQGATLTIRVRDPRPAAPVAVAPARSVLASRALLAVEEWRRGHETKPTPYSSVLFQLGHALESTVLTFPSPEGAISLGRALRRLLSRWDALLDESTSEDDAAAALDTAADRLRMILRSQRRIDAGDDRRADLDLGTAEPEGYIPGKVRAYVRTPSVLYDDTPTFAAEFPEGRFCAGELDGLLAGTADRLLELSLSWGGVAGELRPAERDIVGKALDTFRGKLAAAYASAQELSEALEGTRSDSRVIDDEDGA